MFHVWHTVVPRRLSPAGRCVTTHAMAGVTACVTNPMSCQWWS